MSRATQAAELYPWLRARLWLPLPFTASGGLVSPFTASGGTVVYVAPIGKDATPRRLECGVFVMTTNNASNYWTMTLTIITTAGATTAQGTADTSGVAAGGWNVVTLDSFVTSPWPAATYAVAYLSLTKTGTPGALYLNPVLWVS